MARPKTPLISRRKTLEAALKIVDEDGLDGLSVRRLGAELGVNAASLYHHFKNKDEILIGATQLALSEVRTPNDGRDDGWKVWMVRNARGLRDAIRKHPAVLPIVITRSATGMGASQLNSTAQRLMEEGLPSAAVMPLLDALEFFAIGSALHDIDGEAAGERQASEDEDHAALSRALRDRGLSSDEIFDLVSMSIIEGIERAIAQQRARWSSDGDSADPAESDLAAAQSA